MNLSVNDVVALLGAILPVLIPLGAALYHALVAALPANQQNALNNIVGTVVSAVEQQAQAGTISPDARKAAAVTAVQAIAKQFGVAKYASPAVVNALIECAMFELNQSKASAGAGSPPAGVTVA